MKPSGNLLWLVSLLLTAAGLTLCFLTPPWLGMWLLAGSLFTAAKWAVWWPRRGGVPLRTTAMWFLLWPGMDPAWLEEGSSPESARPLRGIAHLALGVMLLFTAPRLTHPVAAAWTAMAGLINALHFGVFHLLACFWQSRGRRAPLLVDYPLRSRSLTDFWGRRWNTAFHYLSEHFIFRPLLRRLGVTAAMLTVFFASGLVHDLVISVPARGGWGLPTLYFLIQGGGVLLERRWKMRSRVWVWAVTGLPLPLCFPPAFCERVILPLLTLS